MLSNYTRNAVKLHKYTYTSTLATENAELIDLWRLVTHTRNDTLKEKGMQTHTGRYYSTNETLKDRQRTGELGFVAMRGGGSGGSVTELRIGTYTELEHTIQGRCKLQTDWLTRLLSLLRQYHHRWLARSVCHTSQRWMHQWPWAWRRAIPPTLSQTIYE